MSNAVATETRRNSRHFPLMICLLLTFALGGMGLSGCSGVVSGNSGPNSSPTPSGDTTAPTVSITSPAAGATVSGTVNLTANATDNVAVASVQFKVDGTNAGPSLTATPYAYLLNTSSLSNASHSITAVATDTSGNSTTSAAITVQVNNSTPDTTPPTVAITSPANGATVSGTVNVTANATDNVSVASVQFQLDGADVGSLDTASPYTFSWNTATVSNGSHSLRAIAKDGAGNTTTSASVTVTVSNTTTDTTPPTVSITAPSNGATVSGTVSVTATASDNVGVASVQFQLDGANVGALDTTSPYAYSWNTTTASNGSHTLRAIAKDAAGNSTTSASVTVTVSNVADTTAPSVPAGLTATAVSSSQINLSWTASTDNVGVTGYKVYRGGAQIGTSPSTSYQDAGLTASTSYSYTVAAYDAAGNTSAQSASATATTQAASSGGGGIPTTLGWYQIPNTMMSSICPSYSDIQATEGCAGVVNDWGSGLADTKRSRLIVWGGGHNGYYGNEVYSLNLSANPITMTLLRDASHGTAISNLSTCPDTYSDGTPAPRHTGGGLEYLPTQDVYHTHGWGLPPCGSFGNGMWWFNPNTNAWLPEKNPSGGPQPQSEGSVANEAYDSVTDAIYRFEVNTQVFWKYDPSANSWTQLQAYGSGCSGTRSTAVIDPVRRFYFCSSNSGGFWKISLSSPYTETQLNATGCNGLTTDGGAGMAYDSTQKLIVLWQGGDTVYQYNPDTNSCTSVTYSGGPGATAANGTYGRFRYFPALGVFALVNRYNQNAYLLRLTTSSGTSGSTGPAISAVGVNSISQTSGTVTWTTDVSSTSQVEYGTTIAYGTLTTLNSTMVTSHSQVLSGLTAGTLYHYRVHSKNSSGVESVSGDFAFSTNNTSDTTPPSVSITSPVSGASVSGTVSVTANASDNVGVASVQFLLDGVNLGPLDTSSPYQLSWNTTTASNGTHVLSAIALDAAGNAGNAVGVAVTVSNSGTTSSALQDFQTRCSQPGVLVCQGFDDPTLFTAGTWPNSGLYPNDNGSFANASQDTTTLASGTGSLKFTIPGNEGSNPAGYWMQRFGQQFSENSTFYVQYRQRFDPNYLSDTYQTATGATTYWKQQIFSNYASTCDNVEITTINWQGKGFPGMYSQCGQDPFMTSIGNADYLLEQGDTVATGYNCHYLTALNTSTSCFMYPANTWVTFYYKVQIGTWGSPNSTIQAWVSVGGQPYQEWINMPNHTLLAGTGPYDSVTLLPYMTGKDPAHNAGPTAYTWYDELIVSTQPIAAPNN